MKIRFISINILLALIILSAFFIRYSFIELPNLYYDENGVVIWVKLFLNGELSPWAYLMAMPPPLLAWITSVPFIIFGASEFSLRIVNVFFGTLTVVLLYFIAKQWYGRKVALLAAALLAVSPLHVTYSRLNVNSDIVEAFFLVFAVFIMEYCYTHNLERKKDLSAVILSGIAFGFSLLAKFNALVLWGIYWVSIFLFSAREKLKLNLRRLIISNLIALLLVIMSTGFKLSNIFYLIYGFFYAAVAQSTLYANPFYYRVLLLVDALSPLIFLIFIISLIYMAANAYKKRQRSDIIVLSLVSASVLITILQPRSGARHFLIIVPFLVVVISKFIIDFSLKIRKPKFLGTIIILIVVISSASWAIYEIKKDTHYTIWKDVTKYINNNVPEHAVVYSIYPYWPLAYSIGNTFLTFLIERNVSMVPSFSSAKKGDIFVLGNFDGTFDISRQQPFSGALEIFGKEVYRRKLRPYPRTEEFIKKNGELIKTFYCNQEECIWLYKIKDINKTLVKEFGEDEKWSFFAGEESRNNFFSFSCSLIKKKPFSSFIRKLDDKIASSVEAKCKNFPA